MQKFRGLNSSVALLGFISFFSDIASEMLYPITPIFLTAQLGASMSVLGLIEGFAEALASFLKTYIGVWSDRLQKRKPFILVGYLISALSKPAIGLSTHWTHVFLARSTDRIGKGIRTSPRDALLAESVKPNERGAAFGWHRLFDTLGAALGPLLALLWLQYDQENLRHLFLFALLPGLLGVILTLWVREKSAPVIRPVQQKKKWRELPRRFRFFLFFWTLFALVNSSDAFILLKAQEATKSLEHVILLYCFFNVVYALLSPSLGSLSDKIGKNISLAIALLFYALAYGGFAFASAHWHFWVLFGLYGIYMAGSEGVSKALAADLAPEEMKATCLGYLGTATGIATLFASIFAGLLWDHVSSAAPFLFAASGSIVVALALFFIFPSPQPEN